MKSIIEWNWFGHGKDRNHKNYTSYDLHVKGGIGTIGQIRSMLNDKEKYVWKIYFLSTELYNRPWSYTTGIEFLKLKDAKNALLTKLDLVQMI